MWLQKLYIVIQTLLLILLLFLPSATSIVLVAVAVVVVAGQLGRLPGLTGSLTIQNKQLDE